MGRRGWALVAIVAALGVCAARAHAVAPGGLTQLAGAAGCVSNAGAGGCTGGHDLGDIAAVAISPDGRSLYAVTYAAKTLLVFDRDLQTGQLTQKPNRFGCLRFGAATT